MARSFTRFSSTDSCKQCSGFLIRTEEGLQCGECGLIAASPPVSEQEQDDEIELPVPADPDDDEDEDEEEEDDED